MKKAAQNAWFQVTIIVTDTKLHLTALHTTALLKRGIYTDKECDMGNHGGTLFKIKYDGNKITIDSNALYTQKRDYKSVRYVRPVEDF